MCAHSEDEILSKNSAVIDMKLYVRKKSASVPSKHLSVIVTNRYQCKIARQAGSSLNQPVSAPQSHLLFKKWLHSNISSYSSVNIAEKGISSMICSSKR